MDKYIPDVKLPEKIFKSTDRSRPVRTLKYFSGLRLSSAVAGVFSCHNGIFFYFWRNTITLNQSAQMNFPEDLRYTSEHEWVRLTDETTSDGRPIAIVGITDFAQSELGELVYIEVETVGEKLAKDEIFGTVEAVKTTSDLFMPIGGEVLEFNEAVSESGGDDPALINNDPYGAGWIIRIVPADIEEIYQLMGAAAYKELTGH